ncbi:hypothetical protein DVH26_07730 [Paenibacillus sp. H1-7]|uniref:hypothetical protein n=1 Tax=Paenibacillus sp. H1-7 TaxID=2282849 RepID=UPI001EF9921E|nr:hypothetical protein [Paenibacillus sp. H1-7]ULL14348.1 hypothetical protein DVH26_07730 [Paenibacillus sp. H1-7]
MNEINDIIYSSLNEVYGNQLRTIVERDVINEEDYRCISFDAWYQNGDKVGIYAYYSFVEQGVFHIYESAGENLGMVEPMRG